jgi:hypothetical protein
MASKITKEHWSQFLAILIIAGIWVAVFYGYIASLKNEHKVAECEAYAQGKYSITHDENMLDDMLEKCEQ